MSSYQNITFDSTLTFQWSVSSRKGNNNNLKDVTAAMCDFNDLTASHANLNVILSPVTSGISVGESFILNNIGVNSFTVQTTTNSATGVFTNLQVIESGQVFYFILRDNSSSDGLWRVVPWAAGASSITNVVVESPQQSISVANGDITPPGGTITLDVAASLLSLKALTSAGWVVFNPSPTPTFSVVVPAETYLGNVLITNPSATGGAPSFGVSETPTFTTINFSNLKITGNTISSLNADTGSGNVNINATGQILLNTNLSVQENQISVLNSTPVTMTGELIVDGNLINSSTAFAWVVFSDNGTTVTASGYSNLLSVTGSAGAYNINFETAAASSSYAVFTSFAGMGNVSSVSIIDTLPAYVSIKTLNAAGQVAIANNPISVVVFANTT